MLSELIINATATLGTIGGMALIKQWFHRKPLNADGVYLWKDICNWRERFVCPKCGFDKKTQPSICQAPHYPLPHYHFRCKSTAYANSCCGYECIMRSKDDTD